MEDRGQNGHSYSITLYVTLQLIPSLAGDDFFIPSIWAGLVTCFGKWDVVAMLDGMPGLSLGLQRSGIRPLPPFL